MEKRVVWEATAVERRDLLDFVSILFLCVAATHCGIRSKLGLGLCVVGQTKMTMMMVMVYFVASAMCDWLVFAAAIESSPFCSAFSDFYIS